ncbi:uncharacterized protein BP5553_09320 [Venustampulla echinocandica]|uniref:Uncharacterized protein n=1 Tax=Venustampulla echinocandica TaxID=2656787 RepID=A0A370TCE2_9HELO|nr:uncharacterized protein BP5553_09320 [Venustampulla echinocandica]RDL31918.1 hypothetical protein BP5553_09320 [Venustampulla echinocandica]
MVSQGAKPEELNNGSGSGAPEKMTKRGPPDLATYLQRMDKTPHGPALRAIHELFIKRATRDDDFLRRTKNRLIEMSVVAFERAEVITQDWITRFNEKYEGVVKESLGEDHDVLEKEKAVLASNTQTLVHRQLINLQDLLKAEKERSKRLLNRTEKVVYKKHLATKAADDKELLKLFIKFYGT